MLMIVTVSIILIYGVYSTVEKKKTKKTTIFRYLYIILTILVIVLIGVLDPNFEGMFVALESLDPIWLLISIAVLLMYWFTDGLLIQHISSYMYGHYSTKKSLKIGLIGLYYGALTPSATGGQPMQVIYMRRDGIGTGTATGIIGVKLIVYQVSLCAIALASLLIAGAKYYSEYNQVFWLTIIGFIVNIALVIIISLSLFNRTFINKCGFGIINLLAKIHIYKTKEKMESAKNTFTNTMNEFHESMSYIMKHKFRVFLSFLISVVNLLFMFAIPYCIYRAMGFCEHTLFSLLSLQTFLYLAVSFIPTPGSSGASEGGFYLFYGKIFPGENLFVSMLLWRFLTYYAILFVGSAIVLIEEIRESKRKKEKNR